MQKTSRISIAFLLGGAVLLAAWRADGAERTHEQILEQRRTEFQQRIEPLLKQFCFKCHGGGEVEGELNIDSLQATTLLDEERGAWSKVVAKLQSGEMPPEDEPQPTDKQKADLASWLDHALNHVDCGDNVNPGWVTIRRLNRVEYRNTIRDLLGIDYEPADDFPANDVGYGFDNIGDVLSLPPLLMEKYLAAAEEISRQAIVTQFPPPLDRRILAAKLQATRGSRADRSGERILTTTAEMSLEVKFPHDGQYELRIQAYGDQAGDEPVKMAVRIDGKDLKTFMVKNTRDKLAEFTLRAEIKAGKRRIALAFLNDYYRPEIKDKEKRDRNLIVQHLKITGPIGFRPAKFPATHQRIFIANPGQETSPRLAARKILRRLASRAYRREANDAELDRLLELVKMTHRQGDNFESGIQLALQAILVSPHFLFKVELPGQIDDSGQFALDDYQLATSLSYFLWSSMPDDELLQLAWKGKLHNEDTLQRQVRRMLKDPKSQALVDNFAGQWLNLRNLESVTPDKKLFPTFTVQLRDDMRKETEMFFDSIVHENRSLADLLSADYSFLNEALAKHYGVAGVSGEQFRRVRLIGEPRGGLLTHASVLTLTSNPTRTSAVKRGKWVLDNLLGQPPPPPAPDAMPLEDQAELTGTLREQIQQHRADPRCATCHEKMDPLGFALENFDAIGRWRTTDENLPIDAAGELPNGDKFNGPLELQQLLVTRRHDEFVRCVSEKLLTYALGRGVEYYDKCAVDKIVAALGKDDDRFETLVLEIVRSDPFQRRRIPKHRKQE